jgi:hypothetical protein
MYDFIIDKSQVNYVPKTIKEVREFNMVKLINQKPCDPMIIPTQIKS